MVKRISIAVLAMGFSGLVAEILLLRELLIVFSGNELCIGIILANWLILEALGSLYLGRKAKRAKNELETFTVNTILFSLSVFIAVLLTRILKGVIGISIGESIGLFPMVCSSFLILAPVGILHGALFTLSCRIYSMFSGQDASSAGRVYAYETVGTIAGGVLCTYLIIPYLNTFQALSGLALLNMIVCFALLAPYWTTGPTQKAILVALSALVLASGYLVFAGRADRLHQYSIQAQWKDLNIVHYENSQYGNICVIENEGQYIFFQDGIANVITPVPDLPFVEEFTHLPLLAHPEPRSLLILSGGAGGVINEALKHPSIETVDYAELDPLLLDLFRKFPTPLTESELNDERVEITHIDGRLLMKTTRNMYDLVLMGITEPSSLQANRFFTAEFFALVMSRLNKGGIFVLGLPGSLAYSNRELKNLNSSVFHTLESVFSHVRVVPGDGTNLFLVSDSQDILSIDRTRIAERLDQRNITADVMVPWHIENKLHHGWQDWFSSFIQGSSERINSDFKPVALFYSISHWNALYAPTLGELYGQFERINLGTILVLVVFLSLCFIARPRSRKSGRAAIRFSIITTGFAGMIFDLVLIFTFQSVYGYVFSWIGLLVASFMAGAACGAMLATRVMARTGDCFQLFVKIELAIIGFSIGCPFAILAVHNLLGSSGAILFRTLLLAISFFGGGLIGAQFPLANKISLGDNSDLSETAGLLYASDLLGGWFGGMFGAVVFLPLLGLVGTCITVGLLKLASLIVLSTQPYRHL
jgi:spermidine synthase